MRIKLYTWGVLFVLWSEAALAAVSCTTLTQSLDATNSTTYNTASITPGGNRLILLAALTTRGIATGCDADILTTSVTGNGLTWVRVAEECFSAAGAPTIGIELLRAMGASPSTGAITITYSPSKLNAAWAVIECSGVDTSGTNGSGAVVQSATNLVEPGTSLTVTLGAFGSAGNATLGLFGLQDNLAVTPGTGFSELAEQLVSDGGTNDAGLQVQWRSDNDTSVDASFSSVDAGGIAIEIKAAIVTDGAGSRRRAF